MDLALIWIAASAAGVNPPVPALSPGADVIIVTGERVTRSIKDTASSVAVFSAKDLEALPASRAEQVLALVPNVQLGSRAQGPMIRGQDTTGALQNLPAFLGGYRPRTTLVVDGRRTAYHEFIFGSQSVWDVDRVEVFRSPQTTTQGQNSIAGAIIVNTKDPVFEPEMGVRGVIGGPHARQASGVGSGALIGDQLAFRAAADFRYSRTHSQIAPLVIGTDPNHDEFSALRLKLLAVPNALPGTRLVLTYSHSRSQRPEIEGVDPPFQARVNRNPFYGVIRANVDALTAKADLQLNSDLSVNAIASAGDEHSRRFARHSFGESKIHNRDRSFDTVASWSPNGPVKLVGGLSYTHDNLRQYIDLSQLTGIGRFGNRQEGAGLFGEARFAIAPKASLTAGLRYQRDRQTRKGALGTVPLDYDRTFHAWLPKVSLAYDLTSNARAGVLVQRAYNPGGTTLRFDLGTADNFDAEWLWDYELFTRARLADGALLAEANFFYYDMHNAQRSRDIVIRTPAGAPVTFADLFNVRKARSYGLEGNITWRASRRLSWSFALGLLETKIVRADFPYQSYEGKEFQRSPHFSASASIDWLALHNLRLSGQMRFNSAYFSNDLNTPNFKIRPYATLDGRAEWDAGKVTLFGYARNLFDKSYFTSLSIATPPAGRPGLATMGDPREIGLGIEGRF